MNRHTLRRIVPACALALILIGTGCSDSTDPTPSPLGYYQLTGTPDPATVFNAIAETYRFYNNLTNSIWQRQSNIIVTGDFTESGYWAFAQATDTYAAEPDVGTDIHARMVQIPATNTVVYTNTAPAAGPGLGTAANIEVATISTSTGLLSAGETAVFDDSFSGSCQLTSSSATRFLCYDGTVVRRYETVAGSPELLAKGTVALSDPLPAVAECNPDVGCYGSTFAFDGANFYFAASQNSGTTLDYVVYDATGTLVDTYTATGAGAINGTYFDWSVGRYSTHDGFGNRTSTAEYGPPGNDTHSFSAISAAHTLK